MSTTTLAIYTASRTVAVALMRNGVVEGAVGVGGGTAQEDEDCARAGVDLF